ncbi:MAG: hypothetical protein NG737_07615 [Omnitrophica bacterium]|nr:hypothetical protein [Candidatus Omnitrophota bacterium]
MRPEILDKIQELYDVLDKEIKVCEDTKENQALAQAGLDTKERNLSATDLDLQGREKVVAKVESVMQLTEANATEKLALDERKITIDKELQATRDYEVRATEDYKSKLADVAARLLDLERREKILEDGINKLEEERKTFKAKLLKQIEANLN